MNHPILKYVQALYESLGRLSKREKLVFYGAAAFVSLALLDRLIISPTSSKMASLDKQIGEKEAGIKRNLHILAQKDRILSETKKYSSFFEPSKSTEEETGSLLKEIENYANKASVYLINMKPTGLKTSGASRKYIISLDCEAQMEQLVDFMYNIESSEKLLIIEKYQIIPKSKESSVARVNMSIAKIAVP